MSLISLRAHRIALLLALVTAIVLVVTACVSRSPGEAELGTIWQAWSELQAAGDAPLSVQTAAAGAILDRFLHHAEIIKLEGRSYRMHERKELRKGIHELMNLTEETK